MRPPKKEFEKVVVDVWLTGQIVDIKYDHEHEFEYKGVKTNAPGVLIVFILDGYKEKKYTHWMGFNYSKQTTLYKFWITPLVEGAYPNMDFDMDQFKDLPIKVMYIQNGEYQNIMGVRPNKGKVIPLLNESKPEMNETEPEEEVPF